MRTTPSLAALLLISCGSFACSSNHQGGPPPGATPSPDPGGGSEGDAQLPDGGPPGPAAPQISFLSRPTSTDARTLTTRCFAGDLISVRMSNLPASASVTIKA